jgi:hypothetical protein
MSGDMRLFELIFGVGMDRYYKTTRDNSQQKRAERREKRTGGMNRALTADFEGV